MNFIFKGHTLRVPKVASNGLLLYYDMKGKTNQDRFKELVFDVSGQGRNGELQNFAFTDRSGYNEGLTFDGIDDKLKLAPLSLTPTSFTVQMNDVILAYDGADVKRVVNGRIVTGKSGLDGAPKGESLTSLAHLSGNILAELSDEVETTVKDTQTGNPLISTKADNDAVVHVEVDGKSVQNVGSGKNMFEEKMYANRKNFTLGVYSTSKISNLKGNTRYSISASKLIAPELGRQMVLHLLDGTNGQAVFGTQEFTDSILVSMYNLDSRNVKKDDISDFIKVFTTPESGKIYFAYYDDGKYGLSPEGYWFTDKLIEPQLEEGSVRTAYEPPAPSPDNPIPIKNLSKSFDIVSSSVGRNILLNSNDILMNGSDNGNTGLSKKIEDYIQITPTTDGNVYNVSAKTSTDRVKGETYTFSLEVNTQQDYGMYYRPGNWFNLDIVKNTHGTWKRVFFTYLHDGTTGLAKDTFLIGFHGMKKGNTLKYRNLKIEKGNLTGHSATPEDIPYDTKTDTIYKTNIQLSEPLRSVGDVKDRLFLDTDGLWKVERNVGEKGNIKINVGRTWSKGQSNNSEYIYFYTSQVNLDMGNERIYNNKSPLIFNNFKTLPSQPYMNVSEEGVVTWSDSTPFIFVMKLSRLGALTDVNINKWLENNLTTVQYELATPTIETLPQSEQVKLNNIQSFKGINYVYTVANLEPYLRATFKPVFWYRRSLVLTQVKFWNRPLSSEELIAEYKLSKERYTI